MSARWRLVNDAIREFHALLSPSIPPFEVVHAVDKRWTDAEYEDQKPKDFPFRSRGVYLIYGSDDVLLYVGVATKSYASRVFMHDENIERQYIDVIPFRDEHLALAVALEFFLISRLQPKGNRVYREYIVR